MALGLYLSGGADSALLLYTQQNPVVCLTVASEERKHNVSASEAVVEWVKQNSAVNILEHHIVIAEKEEYRREYRKFNREMLEQKHDIRYWQSGKTRNPDINLAFHHLRKADRDTDLKEWGAGQYNPFYNLNKKDIFQLYLQNNILDLWDLTVSCEYSLPPCEGCWWCSERNWAVATT